MQLFKLWVPPSFRFVFTTLQALWGLLCETEVSAVATDAFIPRRPLKEGTMHGGCDECRFTGTYKHQFKTQSVAINSLYSNTLSHIGDTSTDDIGKEVFHAREP